MEIARVFPRKTNATPEDNLVFFGDPPSEINFNEAHISVTFTYDIPKAEMLYNKWSKVVKTKIGGAAFDDSGNEFVPNKYIKTGYVITSRGCNNNCWFCFTPKREGKIREIEIKDGWNVLDSNLLQCSDEHIKNVFKMLSRQKERVEFTGGLESKLLREWHINELWKIRPKQMFFAYDTNDGLEPLYEAGKKLRYADFTRAHLRCYVLIGFKNDTFEKARLRLLAAWDAGFLPMANTGALTVVVQ